TRRLHMSTISIIGSGGMATAIVGRTAKAGYTVEVVSRDPAKARALADQLAAGATTGTYGAAPAGDIVILAVPYTSAGRWWPSTGRARRQGDHRHHQPDLFRPHGPGHPRRQFWCEGDRQGRPRRRAC